MGLIPDRSKTLELRIFPVRQLMYSDAIRIKNNLIMLCAASVSFMDVNLISSESSFSNQEEIVPSTLLMVDFSVSGC